MLHHDRHAYHLVLSLDTDVLFLQAVKRMVGSGGYYLVMHPLTPQPARPDLVAWLLGGDGQHSAGPAPPLPTSTSRPMPMPPVITPAPMASVMTSSTATSAVPPIPLPDVAQPAELAPMTAEDMRVSDHGSLKEEANHAGGPNNRPRSNVGPSTA
jgi:hypothetical protein